MTLKCDWCGSSKDLEESKISTKTLCLSCIKKEEDVVRGLIEKGRISRIVPNAECTDCKYILYLDNKYYCDKRGYCTFRYKTNTNPSQYKW